MDNSSQVDLSSILTPALLQAVLENRLPWAKEEPLDFSIVGPYFWNPYPNVTASFTALVIPVFKHLSTYPLSRLLTHDFLSYLPPPSSPSFPSQALALQLLIDQGGRILRGTDERWKYDFFDHISRKIAHQFLALPPSESPYSKTRWLDEQHATLGYLILARLWLQAPLQHSEDLADHERALVINADTRAEVEASTGTVDPARGNLEILQDTLAYPRWAREGPPKGEGTKMQDFAYWELLMMDVHKCIIERYGGYPQRYAARGGEPTEREKEYLLKTGNFDVIDEESAAIIREDVKAGRWTPLKG